jgi:glycosyltransferase involved in cell wall biosynthesis
MKKCFQIPHCLIVHYEQGKKQLIDYWKVPGERIDVIPHGIMPVKNIFETAEDRRKLNLPMDRQILLMFGSLRPNKGLDVLLEALEIIRKRKPEVLLVVAGALPRGMSYEPYSDIIEKLNLLENVKSFIRFIEDEEVDMFMSASDLVVLPYKKFEAQSGVLLRAYAHKKPVVVSNVGAMGELVTKDKVGLAVASGNVKALADAVIDVLENQDKFQACYNPEIEKKYSWEHIAEMTLKSYEKTIEKIASKSRDD